MAQTNNNLAGDNFLDNGLKEKKIAFITSNLRDTLRAHTLVTLAEELVARGWEITIITGEAQTGKDFLLSQKINRIPVVSKMHKIGFRATEFARLSRELDVSAFVFWNCNRKSIIYDYEAIKASGKAIYLCYEDSIDLQLQKGNIELYLEQEAFRSKGLTTVTPLVTDEFAPTLKDEVGKIVYIPYLFPYTEGDLRPSSLKTLEVLVLADCLDYQLDVIFSAIKKVYDCYHDVKLHIIEYYLPLSDERKVELVKMAAKMGISESVVWEGLQPKPSKMLDNISCIILPEENRQFPKFLPESVCRGVPTIVIKDSHECEDLFCGGYIQIDANDVNTLSNELLNLMNEEHLIERQKVALSVMESEYTNVVFERWEQVFLGEIPKLLSAEYKDKLTICALKNYQNLLQRSTDFWGTAEKFNDVLPVHFFKRLAQIRENFRMNTSSGANLLRSPATLLRKIKRTYKLHENIRLFSNSDISIPNDTRRKLQLLILKMYIEFERICKKNNLRYYLAAGSILGAVRHKGFIPWDDDMDITMPRKDYDKFTKIANSQLGEEFNLNKDAFPYTFSRLEMKGTRETAPLQRKGRYIFLDILPIDCAAPTKKLQRTHDLINKILIACMFDRSRKLPSLGIRKVKVLARRSILKIFFPQWLLLFLWKKNATRFLSDDATHWVCLPGIYGYDGEKFPKEYWGDAVMVDFEGMKIPTMHGWHEYLVEHYGDYMQPIPKAHRRLQHRIFSINLGKYEDMTVEEVEKDI